MVVNRLFKTVILGAIISFVPNTYANANTVAEVSVETEAYTIGNGEGISFQKIVPKQEFEVLNVYGNWTKISYEGMENIYIDSDSIAIKEALGKVNADNVNIRLTPSLSAKVLTKAGIGDEFIAIGKADQWYKIKYDTGFAYIYSDYLEGEFLKDIPKEEKGLNQSLVDFAKQFIGLRYIYGGTSLTNGADCSGFTQSVFKNFGIELNRCSYEQIYNGVVVDKNQLKEGDLVFFATSGGRNISHVGIYIGNGEFIHCSSPEGGGVRIDNLNTNYWIRVYVSASRIIL